MYAKIRVALGVCFSIIFPLNKQVSYISSSPFNFKPNTIQLTKTASMMMSFQVVRMMIVTRQLKRFSYDALDHENDDDGNKTT